MANGPPHESRPTVAARGQPRAHHEGNTPAAPLVVATSVAPIERAQDALPAALRSIPLQALVAATGLGLVSLLTVGLALARGEGPVLALEEDGIGTTDAGGAVGPEVPGAPGAASPTAAPPPARLSAADLDAARLAGVDALRELAQRYPEEPTVLNALCLALRDKQDLTGAMRALRQLLEVAPERRTDKDLHQVLIDIANGPPEAAAEAFDLLKTRMDTVGPDILFEIAMNGTLGRYAREHAAAALSDPAVLRLGTKQLQIADELRRALPCARKLLVKRATTDGDARSIPPLRALLPTTKGCGGAGLSRLFRGGGECANYACLTSVDRQGIAAAIEAIDARDKH